MKYSKEKNITKEELIDILNKSVYDMCFGDIKRASISGEAKMAGFILGACFIDVLAGYYHGLTDPNEPGSGTRFKKFVREYLIGYDKKKLYKDLRCGLVHSYTIHNNTYSFTDKNKAGKHFQKLEGNKILLNLEDFIRDIEGAYFKFVDDIRNDDEVFKKARKRLRALKTLGVRKIY